MRTKTLGQRYKTLRALAHHLDETARGALKGAIDDVQHGASSEARFLASIRSFARDRRRLPPPDGQIPMPASATANIEPYVDSR